MPMRRDADQRRATSDFLPNPQQAAAINHNDGPAAFIAAAGTGKTAILVQRLVRLIAEAGVAPERILCVTFTRAAAEEMEKRALRALKARGHTAAQVKGLRVVTFHGLGHQMLREKLGWTPRELNQRLISGDPRQWLAEDILRPWRSNRARGMNWSVDVADALRAVDRAKDALQPPADSAAFFARDLLIEPEVADRFAEFYARYEDAKKGEKRYDLADLIYVPLRWLEQSPTYRAQWRDRYRYLQVDETQDTNPAQYLLIQHLARPQQNVVVVGDPDQAIYQFRGASPEASILSFRAMYPQGTIYRIEHNYRSTPQILAAANALIAHNPTTPGFEKLLRATQPDGAAVAVTAYEDQEREAEGVADRIAALTGDPAAPLTFREIFILSRTNQHLASLELTLAARRIPYRAVGGSSFFKRKTTRDMLAYLALADGMRLREEALAASGAGQATVWERVYTPLIVGELNAAFRAVANIPSAAYLGRTGKTSHRFTPTFIGTLTSLAGGRPLQQLCEDEPYRVAAEFQLPVRDVVALIRQIWQGSHNHPAAAMRLARELAYDAHLRHYDGRHQEADDEDAEAERPKHDEEQKLEGRFDELDELITIAQRHKTIRHFLDAMRQLKEQAEDTRKNKRDCVSLLTIHKSKGLEAPVVFVIGLTEGIFPHRRSFTLLENENGPPSGVAEERRLAYVAFTRARRQLFLSCVTRYRGGDALASRFIAEAGLEPVDAGGLVNPFLIRRAAAPRKRSRSAPSDAPTLFDALVAGEE